MNRSDGGLKVALATDWFLPHLGGIELHLADLARALQSRGVDVHIVTTTPGPERIDDLLIRRLAVPRLFDVAVSPGLIGRLKAEFAAGGYGLVHAHISVVSPVGYGAVLAAHALGLPTVVTFCGVLLRSAEFLRVADRLLGWSHWRIAVTAVSGLIAGQLRAAVPGLAVTVLPNGVDGAFWRRSPARPERKAGGIVAIAAMRLNRKKRPWALLRAFAQAHSTVAARGRRLILRVAGDGPLRGQLEGEVERLGLGADIAFLGPVPRPVLAEQYRRADLFLMPSIHESFGIAALEARYAGLPVIGMRQAGITEFLRHGETAMLAADDTEFARYLETLALDDAQRLRLAETEPDLARFDWSTVVEAHLACYARAIAAATSPAGASAE
jgi:glycosyltransferase involved in cell wall biosynthesis